MSTKTFKVLFILFVITVLSYYAPPIITQLTSAPESDINNTTLGIETIPDEVSIQRVPVRIVGMRNEGHTCFVTIKFGNARYEVPIPNFSSTTPDVEQAYRFLNVVSDIDGNDFIDVDLTLYPLRITEGTNSYVVFAVKEINLITNSGKLNGQKN